MDKVTLVLPEKSVQLIVVALGELPAKHVHDLLNTIDRQVRTQRDEAAAGGEHGPAA